MFTDKLIVLSKHGYYILVILMNNTQIEYKTVTIL